MTNFEKHYQFAEEMNFKEAMVIFKKLKEAEGQETAEKLHEILTLIEGTVTLPKPMKQVMLTKYRVLKKRLKKKAEPSMIGLRMAERRKELNLTMTKAAKLTDDMVSISFWSRIEKGERLEMSATTIKAIARALQLSADELLQLALESQKQKPIPLNQLIIDHRVLINEEEASMDQKKAMIELLTIIHDAQWNEGTKHMDSLKIAREIEKYKSRFCG